MIFNQRRIRRTQKSFIITVPINIINQEAKMAYQDVETFVFTHDVITVYNEHASGFVCAFVAAKRSK